MTGLILAAGVGKRLAPLTDDRPKGLLELGGRTLLARLLDGLAEAGVERTAVVVGYRQEAIRAALGASHRGMVLSYLENPAYTRGPLLSLWTGRAEFARGDVVLADGDVLFAPPLLERVVGAAEPNVFLAEPEFVDTGEEQILYFAGAGGEAAPAPLDRSPVAAPPRVVAIRRGIMGPPKLAHDGKAEWVGFAKIGRVAGSELAALLDRWIAANRSEGDYEAALDALLSGHRFVGCSTDGLPWIEIDFPQDLHAAEAEILPRISSARPTFSTPHHPPSPPSPPAGGRGGS